jgi:uncharacterized membrane protein
MSTRTKLAAYTLVLVAACGVGALVGATVGPDRDDDPAPAATEPAAAHELHDE